MARGKRSTSSRHSRVSGIRSGVTYFSLPSGVTIQKTGVTATQFTTGNPSGVTITEDTIQNTFGYMAGFYTDGYTLATGVTTVGKGYAVTQQFTGISTILSVQATIIPKLSSSTNLMTNVSAGSAYDQEWPAAGVTNVAFQTSNKSGSSGAVTCSVAYFVVGTA